MSASDRHAGLSGLNKRRLAIAGSLGATGFADRRCGRTVP